MVQPFLLPNLDAKMARATCAAPDFPPISTTKNPNQTIEDLKILQELNNVTQILHTNKFFDGVDKYINICWEIFLKFTISDQISSSLRR